MATQSRQGLTLDKLTTYQIVVPVELDESWTEWDDRMRVEVVRREDSPPVTVISGPLDQAALHGLLRRLYALGLPIESVNRVDADGKLQSVPCQEAE